MKKLITLLENIHTSILTHAGVTHLFQLSSIVVIPILVLILFYILNKKDKNNNFNFKKRVDVYMHFTGEIDTSFSKIFESGISNLRGDKCVRVDIFIDTADEDVSNQQIESLRKYLYDQENLYSSFGWFVYIAEEQGFGGISIYTLTLSLTRIPEMEKERHE